MSTPKFNEVTVPTERLTADARIAANLAFLLGDVTETAFVEAERRSRALGYYLRQRTKQNWADANRLLHSARRAYNKLAAEIYEIPDATTVEKACEDSDFFFDILLLIIDRVGDDSNKQQQLRALLYNSFPSAVNIYDKFKSPQ